MVVTVAVLALGFVASTCLRALWALFLVAIDGIDRKVNYRRREQMRIRQAIWDRRAKEMQDKWSGRK